MRYLNIKYSKLQKLIEKEGMDEAIAKLLEFAEVNNLPAINIELDQETDLYSLAEILAAFGYYNTEELTIMLNKRKIMSFGDFTVYNKPVEY